ncbi:hypothetical protein HDF26_005217 [Pedobacter cryoconitis]|uniref:Uncharacterized protein n=1 Tax=Pedobacter cryoconitis TaxID=188932 RepID=A0A7W9DZ97_9SPHI|nr:hypothetical protein [Pedobacter cryoconitis]MBB5636741.1 hypothetical protein [Pedobacter cryoconitis]MBB6274735.1 hypothetical protein [Pedobacter cryoconitis]
MKEYRIYEQQSWWDISMHEYGTAEFATDLAVFNNSSPVENLVAGRLIFLPDYKPEKLVLLSMKNIPATGFDKLGEGAVNKPQGIDYWAISYDFIVS